METATMAAATSGGPPAATRSLLRVTIGREVLALPIEEVREILQIKPLTPLPRTPAFVHGLMNLRGAVVPVIDLAARLGRAPAVVDRRSCVVVVEHACAPADADDGPAPLVAGLLVDAVLELFDALPGEVEPVPPLGTATDAAFLVGMTRARGEVIGILDLANVLAPDTLLAMIADHGLQ